jgi:F0F1-type ATP synthase assembly protein I
MFAEKIKIFIESTILAAWLTGIPIALLIILAEFDLKKPLFLILWLIFTLFWTFYNLHRYVNRQMKESYKIISRKEIKKEVFAEYKKLKWA